MRTTRFCAATATLLLLTNVTLAQTQQGQAGGTQAQTGGVGNQTGGGQNQASAVESSAIQGAQQGVGGQGGGLGGQNQLQGFFDQSGSSFFESVLNPQTGGQAARMFTGGGFGGGGIGGRTGGTTSKSRRAQSSFRIAFPRSASLASPQVQAKLRGRLGRLSQRVQGLQGVQIQAGANGQVTLTGQVQSADTRRLAANLVRMEPGVRSVKNNLTVPAPTSSQ